MDCLAFPMYLSFDTICPFLLCSILQLCIVPCSDAKTDIKNDDGKIPIEVAELNEQEAAVKALKEGKSATAKSDKSGKESSEKKKATSSQDSKQDVYL